MKKLKAVTSKGSYLEQLKSLAYKLALKLDDSELDDKNLAALAKQYRETIKEIKELEGDTNVDDEISEILQERKADGKSKAVRQIRS